MIGGARILRWYFENIAIFWDTVTELAAGGYGGGNFAVGFEYYLVLLYFENVHDLV